MQKVLDQNQALSRRLEEFGIPCGADDRSTRFFDDGQSVMQTQYVYSHADVSPPVLPTLEDSVPLEAAINSVIAPREWENTLVQTRVYMGVRSNSMDVSFRSSAIRTNAWSLLSGISLNDISIISVIGMPISWEEINSIGPDLTFASIISASSEVGLPRSAADRPSSGSRSLPTAKSSRWSFGIPSRRRTVSDRLPDGVKLASDVVSDQVIYKHVSFTVHVESKMPKLKSKRPTRGRSIRPSSTGWDNIQVYKLLTLGDSKVGKTALTIQVCQGWSHSYSKFGS